MRNKRLLRTLTALCLTLVLASGFTVPAFAQGAAPPPAEDTTNDSNVVVEETEKAPPLTPEGNAALGKSGNGKARCQNQRQAKGGKCSRFCPGRSVAPGRGYHQ